MATFKLNDVEIPFQPGDTIIKAAWRQSIEIPHYCWHPGLSVAANCRMCLVEIKSAKPMMLPILRWDEEKKAYVDEVKPKLVPACQVPAEENMEVVSKSPLVLEAQAAVQESLLLNHPVDCPICDQSGECKLQDYWLDHQASLKRKKTEPVHKPKAVRFGPTIVYDAERCIMCTRCIRFCDEVVGDHVLDMRERGNENEIVLSPGRELNNDYTLMTEHVCPVGALTSRDFRFKARVWFLRTVPSVCPGCATGCNSHMDYDPRYQRVERLRPRDNSAVNGFWMCDDGMMTYHRMRENRILMGFTRVPRETILLPDLLEKAASELKAASDKKLAVVFSAQHSNEDNFALLEFAQQVLRTDRFYLAALGGWRGDDILRNPDNNPNRKGVETIVGRPMADVATLIGDAAQGKIDGLIVLGWATSQTPEAMAGLEKLPVFINLTSHTSTWSELAQMVVPIATHGEVDGTFVNAQGLAQKFRCAVKPPQGLMSAWETLRDLSAIMGSEALSFANLSQLRAALPDEFPTLPSQAQVQF